VTFDMAANEMEVHQRHAEPWRVTLVDTGEETQTGGRLRRVADHVADEDEFCFTYGDGLSDVDIAASIAFHRAQGREATVTAVRPPGRWGSITRDDSGTRVTAFEEKGPGEGGFINGGFFVLSPSVIGRIDDDSTTWEREPLQRLAADGQLSSFAHEGFWQPMDTLRERNLLEDLWRSGSAPWKRW
jgi:glucose-1-phosphate cytidylyltransferase